MSPNKNAKARVGPGNRQSADSNRNHTPTAQWAQRLAVEIEARRVRTHAQSAPERPGERALRLLNLLWGKP